MAVNGISIYGRDTSGVRVMKLSEDAKVISVARIKAEDKTQEEETIEE